MKKIKLINGGVALVDDYWYEYLNQWTWRRDRAGYAARRTTLYNPRRCVTYLMHRVIMGAKEDEQVDHRNSIPLDCQKRNLRITTQSQNRMNSKKMRGCLSKFKYVRPDRKRGNFVVRLGKNRDERYIGTFKNEHHAALAADLWAIDLYGDFAKTNFPVVAHSSYKK